jgi:hypothetical protein
MDNIYNNIMNNNNNNISASDDEDAPEETQFLKNEFSANVREYIVLEEQVARLNKAVRERRTKLKEISNSIMKTMEQNDINHINIKNGVLVHNSKETFKGLNKKSLQNGLTIYFNENKEQAEEATSTVMNSREKVVKKTLKYKKFTY